ncbi:MAG TPA: TolC family protein [Anaeromyxobacteraceae bacterium]|nr:TolC family protein [Anaeromyxobacteraceae bacterium]
MKTIAILTLVSSSLLAAPALSQDSVHPEPFDSAASGGSAQDRLRGSLQARAESRDAPRQLTLDDALALATRRNLDLQLARADVSLSEADVSRAVSGFLPRLDLTASGGHDWTGKRAFFSPEVGSVDLPQEDSESYLFSLDFSQPLFTGFRSTRDLQAARAARRGAERLYDETELSVAFEVTRQFYELVKAERSLDVLVENARRSQELADRADALYAAGKMSKSDTIQARVNLGNDQIAIQNQRITIQLRRSALATALGLPADEQLQPVAPPTVDANTLPSGEPPPLATLVESAKARRPLLRADVANVEAARAAIGAARADYWPQLSLGAGYGRSGAEFSGSNGVFSSDLERQYQASAGVTLRWNLFEGGLTRSNVRRAQANESRVRATAERNDVLVAQQIADARAGVLWLTEAVKLAAANLAVAEQGVRLATERLEAGLLSQLEARDANLKLTQSQLALVEARIDHAIAVADLNRAVGGTL